MKDIALLFAALADPTRLRLLHLMRNGEICVCFLQGVLQTNQPKISRHLAYLRKAGVVEARRDGKWMHYRLQTNDKTFGRILTETLERVAAEPESKADLKRLNQIRCCPSKFGVSSPMPTKSVV